MFLRFSIRNKLQNLEKLLFYGIVLFLPAQLGKHFWPSFSLIEGLRVDYLSPTLYLTDVLIVLLFATWFFCHLEFTFSAKKRKASSISESKKILIPFGLTQGWRIQHDILEADFRKQGLLVVLATAVLIGIYFSASPIAGIYKLAKIIEFGFFGFYVAHYVNLKKDFSKILLLLSAGVIFESILGIVQFYKQASFGGILWFFGERTFSGQTPGIANAIIDGRLVLRAYGTFSHPNVLAGYLTIALTMIISSFQFPVSNFKKNFFILTLIIGTVGLLLTLSRVAILLWFLVLCSWSVVYVNQKWTMRTGKWKIFLLVVSVIIAIIGFILQTPLVPRFASITDVDYQSYSRRQLLNIASIDMFNEKPLFGVGLNNFLVELPDFLRRDHSPKIDGSLWLQPVHNVYLLIASETGVIGVGLFFWFIWKTTVRIKDKGLRIKDKKFIIHHSSFILLATVLFLGMFDHYLLTLQQGQLLFAFVLGIAWSTRE